MATWIRANLQVFYHSRVISHQRSPGKQLFKNFSTAYCRAKSDCRHYPNRNRTAHNPNQQQKTGQTDHSRAGDPHEENGIQDHDLPTERSATQISVSIELMSPGCTNQADMKDDQQTKAN